VTVTEEDARYLAREINRSPGWTAFPDEHLITHAWSVRAHHRAMHATGGGLVRYPNPYPTLPITSREEWEAAHQQWGD
jgi:hypothetical protein